MENFEYPPAEAWQNDEIHTPSASGVPQPCVVENPEPTNRSVKRNLLSIHIFLIVISGTIGMGLFQNSGEILAIAGSGGGITAYILVGFGVIMVMEGIAEMVTHWPISNAMVEFVRVFIDKELAVVIGVAYTYAYSISFSTLIIAASDLASLWTWPTALQDIAFILLAPVALLLLNCFGVLYYGNIEAVCGVLKIALVVFAFLAMCIINHLEVPSGENSNIFISEGFQNNPNVAATPGIAALVAFPIAAYAYLGVEIVAVTAVEAKTPQKSLRFPARNIAWITTVIYVTSVISYYFNVSWTDEELPSYDGRITAAANSQSNSMTPPTKSSSLVIIAALNAGEVPMSNVLLSFLIMAVLSAANTALYVSSRTLWGLACNLDPQLSRSRYIFWRWLSKLSNTTPGAKVPGWALIVCALGFWWLLPFSRLANPSSAVNVEEIMSGAVTNAVVLVWASQCIAFIRYRGWLWEYQDDLSAGYAQFDHYNSNEASRPFNSNLGFTQRAPAVIGLIFCFVTAVLFSTASWWNGYKSAVDIVSAFVGFAVLFVFWLLLKLWRFLRGDDFEWFVTVRTWNDLRRKLDGLTNAIHTRDYDHQSRPAVLMHTMLPPSQTPLVDQLPAVNDGRSRTPGEQYRLGIFQTPQEEIGESSGYVGPVPADRTPQGYGRRDQELYAPGEDSESYSTVPGTHQLQYPRRRSQAETSRRN